MKAKRAMDKGIWLAVGNLVMIFVLVAAARPALADASPGAPVPGPESTSAQIEVEPELLIQLDAEGTGGYLIYLRERPDLSPASQMNWQDRGRFVVEALQEMAKRTQARLRRYLDSQGARYQAFWIDNVIVVDSSTRATFQGLMSFPEIAALRAPRIMDLIEPVEKASAEAFSVQAVEANLAHVKADQAWALGYRGEGLVVANIDSGVRYSHAALATQYRGNLGGGVYEHAYNWLGAVSGSSVPVDDGGHGTHTMGIMVGSDGAGNEIGMAPGAKWIACDACESGVCPGDALLTCAQWIAAPYPPGDPAAANPDLRPQVVNNSWTTCSQTYSSWYQGAVDSWHAAGIYPVFANGNSGNCAYSSPPGCNTVGVPARYGNVTGVGATGQSNGAYASFSNWGPTDDADMVNPRGYPAVKPQVVAPGVSIRSSYAGGDEQYVSMSGTSMAAPHVAGLVALIWQASPCLAGDYAATETILETTAHAIPYATGCGGEGPGNVPNNATGWGEIDALAAVQAARSLCWPDFSLEAGPDLVDVCAPQAAAFNVELGQHNGFGEAVALSASGQPAGTTVSFEPNSLVPPATSLLTIGGTAAAAPGTYEVHVAGTSGALVHEDTVMLRLSKSAPDAPLLTNPAVGSTGQPTAPGFAWSAAAGAGGYDIEIAADPGFAQVVDAAEALVDTAYSPGAALQPDTVYYWRVRAVNACGGTPSATGAFRTAAGPNCAEYVLNGDFELGKTGWVENGDIVGQGVTPHAGSWYAEFGGEKKADDRLSQVVSLPAGASSTLTYWYSIDSSESVCDGDLAGVKINGARVRDYGLCAANSTGGDPPYHQAAAVDLSSLAGSDVEIGFWTTTDTNNNLSRFRIDDVSLVVCVGAPPVVADYSDLAGGYGVAWHSGDGSLRLGTAFHTDDDFASGGDSADDDGVSFDLSAGWDPGGQGRVYVNVTGGTAGRYLAGWFDWNDDGDFEEEPERPIAQAVTEGLNSVSFSIPAAAGYSAGRAVNCRFRLYEREPLGTLGAEMPWGGADGGEVEDYRFAPPAPTAVELAGFDVVADGPALRVEWQTASELDLLGFNLYRSDAPDGRYLPLNDALLPAQMPGSPTGGTYTWLDESVAPGATYFYLLQVVDVHGAASLSDPLSATAAGGALHRRYLPLVLQRSGGE